MTKRDTYKVLSEKYETVQEDADIQRTIIQAPYSVDEKNILTALYDFKEDPDNFAELHRIYAAGEVEVLVKYSDNSFVLMTDTGRSIVKKEYNNFYELMQSLRQIYKANKGLAEFQVPAGQGIPGGVEAGGQK